jgi:ABC-type transport system involved in multi-copper enzyme maturation permease subunit
MTVLPIVERELRVAARRHGTFWMRVAFAGVGALIAGWALGVSHLTRGLMGNIGQIIFSGLSGLGFVYCLVAGVFATADTLSEEKREGTLGLMFLTDLRSFDVVLGKLTASSIHWLFGLLAVFPILAMGMLLGGVGVGEFWRRLLSLVSLLVVSLSAGMLVSSVSRHAGKAMAGTIGLLFLLLIGPPWLAQWHQGITGALEPTLALMLMNPAQPWSLAEDAFYSRRPEQFWWGLAVSGLTAVIMLGLACVLLGRTWRERAASAREQRWRDRWRDWRLGSAMRRPARRRIVLEDNPYLWVGMRDRLKPWIAAVIVVSVGAWLWWAAATSSASSAGMPFLYGWATTILFFQAALKVWVTFAAARRFLEDRRGGALELLLCTPLGVPRLIRGHWGALWRQFSAAVLLVLAGVMAVLVHGLLQMQGTASSGRGTALLICFAGETVFIADLLTLACLATWYGMTSRHTYLATGRAILAILVLPWVAFYGALTGVMLVAFTASASFAVTGSGGGPGPVLSLISEPAFYVGLWWVIAIGIDVAFGGWAWRRLFGKFRSQAERSFDAGPSRHRRRASAATPPPLVPLPPPIIPDRR